MGPKVYWTQKKFLLYKALWVEKKFGKKNMITKQIPVPKVWTNVIRIKVARTHVTLTYMSKPIWIVISISRGIRAQHFTLSVSCVCVCVCVCVMCGVPWMDAML